MSRLRPMLPPGMPALPEMLPRDLDRDRPEAERDVIAHYVRADLPPEPPSEEGKPWWE